jgi:hypothetical protein
MDALSREPIWVNSESRAILANLFARRRCAIVVRKDLQHLIEPPQHQFKIVRSHCFEDAAYSLPLRRAARRSRKL